jgi:hypothetical protein
MKKIAGFFLVLTVVTGCHFFRSPPDAPQLPAKTFMEQYDRNLDGRVSTDEFDGRLREFFKLDWNRDGVITANEAPDALSSDGIQR